MSAANKKANEKSYDADDITALEGLEPVRLRPGMYVGDTGIKGLTHCVKELVDNSVDEALAGYCTEILVTLGKDQTVKVADNGRGIPVGINSKSGKPAVMMVFEELHAGGKFGDSGYAVSGGLHGVGASVTNALAEWLEVEVKREGYLHHARWERGLRVQELRKGKKAKGTGTTVSYRPDFTIFPKGVHFDPTVISRYLKEKSYLVRGVTFRFQAEGLQEQVFHSEEGIRAYVREMAEEHLPIPKGADPLFFQTEAFPAQDANGQPCQMGVEVALQWTTKSDERVYSFANAIPTGDGGTHVTGLKQALTKALNNYAYESGKLKKEGRKEPERFEGRDVTAALTAAVLVKISNPQFEGQTKGRLNNPEARSATQSFLYGAFTEWLADRRNAKNAKEILERCLHSRKVRIADGKTSKNYNPNSIWADSGQSAKLADVRDPETPVERRELFIVEGDSAGGTAKEARDSTYQAILPLRGKPINPLTNSNKKVFENAEVIALAAALGGRIEQVEGENYVSLPRAHRRFSRVTILSDADMDGAHIANLIINIFHEIFPDFLREGRVFIGKPPLFSINLDARGERVIFAYTPEEMSALVKKHRRSSEDVTRFKGLGEMDSEELRTTVMDPETRSVERVSIPNPAEMAETLKLILGSQAEPRREWLENGGAAQYLEEN